MLNNFFKRKFLFLTLASMVLAGGTFHESFAESNVSVGDQLIDPETGWTRFNDTEEAITYEGDITYYNGDSNHHNDDLHLCTLGSKVKFNFTGSKLRLLITQDAVNHVGGRYQIKIDDSIVDEFTMRPNAGLVKVFVAYQKLDLEDREHSVEITILDTLGVEHGACFDAIDIDSDGALKSYDPQSTSNSVIIDINPEKEKIKVTETVYTDLVIDNISEIAAEDIHIQYDSSKLEYIGFEETDGIKLVKALPEKGQLRFILASKGEENIVNSKKTLLQIQFKGIHEGEALVDITKTRVSDGIEMEKDLDEEKCDEATIIIEGLHDVNGSGEFTLLDLAIDARHFQKDPSSDELSKYNTDIAVNNAIDEDDLLEIGKLMIENPNYPSNR